MTDGNIGHTLGQFNASVEKDECLRFNKRDSVGKGKTDFL